LNEDQVKYERLEVSLERSKWFFYPSHKRTNPYVLAQTLLSASAAGRELELAMRQA
jgi:hypothetical protein